MKFPGATDKANLTFLDSTKTGLTTINGWVTNITKPVNKYIDKIRDWGSRSAPKSPDHPLKSVNDKIKTVTGAVNNFQKSVLTSLKNFFTYLTDKAHLKFLDSTKNGLDTINGWVTKTPKPVTAKINNDQIKTATTLICKIPGIKDLCNSDSSGNSAKSSK
ncbi:hypothetical protein [Tropheryma whipplei]|uniref:hypothetical protein n=1 Tax=Tropheryma whipplei TaxID=2039 RepID=UPI000317F718|nr:hypothetical protein [Tropheryma whipplei]